jgi:hypothetical protein
VRIERHTIERSVQVGASAESVWREVTQVDVASFRHPVYLSTLGIPKPLRAEVLQAGVGGARIALFENNLRFSQHITEWQPGERYAFTFQADPGFRVGYLLDLANGPFRMIAGAYRIVRVDGGVTLSLSSEYELRGMVGALLRLPASVVLHFFQSSLLRGIAANAERRDRRHD